MDIRTIITKTKNYSLGELCIILIYKSNLKLLFALEKIRITFNPQRLDKYYKPIDLKELSSTEEKFCEYYHHCKTDIERILNRASEILKNKITLFGTTFNYKNAQWLVDPISGKEWDRMVFFSDAKYEVEGLGDVKYVMEYNKMYHLVVLAQAYYVSSDDKYVKAIDESLNNWVKYVIHERSVVNNIIMDIAFRCINLIHICLLCIKSSYFNKATLPLILNIIKISESQMRRFSTPRWFKTGNGANHTVGEMVGLIIAQLWLSHFTTKMRFDKAIKEEFIYLNITLTNTISKQGVYLEQSANYSRLVAEFLLLLDIFINAIGYKSISTLYNPSYLKLLLKYLKRIAYHGELPNFGDNDNAKVIIPFHDETKNIEYLLNYLQKTEHDIGIISDNKGVVCQQNGQWAWKSVEENDVYIFTRVGPYAFFEEGTAIHSHSDMLALVLYAKQKPIFIDRGTFLYNSGLSIRNNDRGVEAHNTISFDKEEQAEFLDKWAYLSYPDSKILTSIGDEKSCYFEGEVTYGNIKHLRTIVYLNSIIRIIDNVTYTETNIRAQQNFLISEEIIPHLISKNAIDLFIGYQKLATIHFDYRVHLEIIDADYFPSYGELRKTKKIIAQFDFCKTCLLETKINF